MIATPDGLDQFNDPYTRLHRRYEYLCLSADGYYRAEA